MFHAVSRLAIVSLLALWSLAAWALHATAAWAVANAGAFTGAASGVGAVALPDGLAPWVPAEILQALNRLTAGFGPLVDSLLLAAPALDGGLTVATWGVWALGSVILLLLGLALHLVIAMWRRRGRGGAGPGAGPALATG